MTEKRTRQIKSSGELVIDENTSLDQNLPRNLRVRICDAVLAFSELEHSLINLIAALLRLDPYEAAILTDISFTLKRGMARRMLFEHMTKGDHLDRSEFDRATSNIWPAMDDLATDRNFLVHGRLRMVNAHRLLAISARPNHAAPETTLAAEFPISRLESATRGSRHLSEMFYELARRYSDPSLPQILTVEDRTEKGLEGVMHSRRVKRRA